jgi:membrane fusion protein (multidrug efflux system)
MEGESIVKKTIFLHHLVIVPLLIFILFVLSGKSYAVDEGEIKRVPVKCMKVSVRDMSTTLDIMGAINYLSKVDVSSETYGLLSAVKVEEGDFVKKGQIIAVNDSVLLQAQLQKLKAKVESTKVSMEKLRDNLEVKKKVFSIGGIIQSELNEAEMKYQDALAAYKSALADLEEIQKKIEKTFTKAPISGIVSNKKKWVGESTSQQDSVIATIIHTGEVYAEADVNESSISYVKVGQRADVTVDAYPSIRFTGKVHLISPTLDTSSRTVKVQIKVLNRKSILKPGMFVRVKVIRESHRNVVAIPREAILTTKDGRTIIFVVVNEIAFARDVQTGSKNENLVVIQKGLKAGEKLVVEGQELLRDLASVRSVEIK